MANISPTNINDGDAVTAASVNNQINTIVNDYNGNVDNTNIKSGANISGAKLADGTVTNAKLDSTAGAAGGAWLAWTPTFTNLTVGNGVHASSYTQIGKTIIARLQFTLGTTSSMATGTTTFTLPVTSVSAYIAGCHMGTARANTNTASMLIVRWASTTTGDLKSELASGTYLAEDQQSATVPGTWGTGSTIVGTFTYQAA